MSTTQRELEELRKVREAERLHKEEQRRIEEEKAAKIAKKNEFLNRAALFQKKSGPTDEEVKLSIQKASKQRKFGRELNKVLNQQPPGANPFATELRLKGKTSEEVSQNGRSQSIVRRSSMGSVWEIVEQVGGRPYYWNRVTNETTYDPPSNLSDMPLPPPPPPKYQLPGIAAVQSSYATTETTEEYVTQTTSECDAEATDDTQEAPTTSWVMVQEPTDANPYYWNAETNETTYELPLGVEIAPYVAPTVTDSNDYDDNTYEEVEQENGEQQQINDGNAQVSFEESSQMWQEITSPSGETVYLSLINGDSRVDKPEGVTIIISEDNEDNNDGGEVHWQECIGGSEEEEGGLYYYYQNMANGDMRADRPIGLVMIAESV